MFSAVLTIKSMGSFVHTAGIFFITHFMIFIAYACVKDSFVRIEDNFKRCKYIELDYAAHKIAAFLLFFPAALAINLLNTCSLSKDE